MVCGATVCLTCASSKVYDLSVKAARRACENCARGTRDRGGAKQTRRREVKAKPQITALISCAEATLACVSDTAPWVSDTAPCVSDTAPCVSDTAPLCAFAMRGVRAELGSRLDCATVSVKVAQFSLIDTRADAACAKAVVYNRALGDSSTDAAPDAIDLQASPWRYAFAYAGVCNIGRCRRA